MKRLFKPYGTEVNGGVLKGIDYAGMEARWIVDGDMFDMGTLTHYPPRNVVKMKEVFNALGD